MSSEAYQKMGRGGAGNFYSKQDTESLAEKPYTDIESQLPGPTSSSTTTTSQLPAPGYLHTGRGGAGNWIQPAELSSSGLNQVTSPSQKAAQKEAYQAGRGGAGNWVDSKPEEEQREKDQEERIKREVHGKVEENVEKRLRRPERAFMGAGEGRERSRGEGEVWEVR